MPQPPIHIFSQVSPNIQWMVDPLTQNISCVLTQMIPFLDGIIISLLCHYEQIVMGDEFHSQNAFHSPYGGNQQVHLSSLIP
jgi:hypothetical protein